MDKAKLKELFGDAKDISSINEIIKDMKKRIIELLYDEELKEYLIRQYFFGQFLSEQHCPFYFTLFLYGKKYC